MSGEQACCTSFTKSNATTATVHHVLRRSALKFVSRLGQEHFADLNLSDKLYCGGGHIADAITSIKVRSRICDLAPKPTASSSCHLLQTYPGGVLHATTEHGRIIFHRPDFESLSIQVCAQTVSDLPIPRAANSFLPVHLGLDW